MGIFDRGATPRGGISRRSNAAGVSPRAASSPFVSNPWDVVRRYLAITRGSGSIPELDGIRALAILLVLARHGARPYWDGVGSLLPVAGLGPRGSADQRVDRGRSLLRAQRVSHHASRRQSRYGDGFGRRDVGDYMLRRVLRIVPLYVVVLFVAAWGSLPAVRGSRRGPGAPRDLSPAVPPGLPAVEHHRGVLVARRGGEVLPPGAGGPDGGVPAARTTRRYAALLALAAVPSVLRCRDDVGPSGSHRVRGLLPGVPEPVPSDVRRPRARERCVRSSFAMSGPAGGPRPGSPLAHGLFGVGGPRGWSGCCARSRCSTTSAGSTRSCWRRRSPSSSLALLLGLTLGGGPRARGSGGTGSSSSRRSSYSLYLVHYPMVPARAVDRGAGSQARPARPPGVQFVAVPSRSIVALSIGVALRVSLRRREAVPHRQGPPAQADAREPTRAPVLATVTETG